MIDLTEDEIASRLAATLPESDDPTLEFPALRSIVDGPPRPAAVLVPFLRLADGWHILYTRRNANLPEHSGQVAFPGGRADPDDPDPRYTALREAHEEIGLNPAHVRVLGQLRRYLTITNYQIPPIVGAIPGPYVFTPADYEVSRIFTIPLEWLADPSNHEVRLRPLPTPHTPAQVIYFKPYDGEVLWGASARMTLNLLSVLNENKERPA